MTSTAHPRAAIILAAGQGTRMKSALPKVLHPVGGRAMLDHAIDAAEALGCERIVVVVGAHSPEVRDHVVKRLGEDAIAVQDPPLGTGHAVRAAEAVLGDFVGQVVITYGDVPLLRAADIEPVFAAHEGVTVIGFEARDPGAYGRLVMEGDTLAAITEAKEASAEVLALTACNSGVMAAPVGLLFELLAEVKNDNAKGEFYLTDVVELARRRGAPTRAVFADEDAVMGVNAQGELAVAEALFQKVQRETFLAAGVTMPAPETVHFSFDTEVGGGTTIEPYVVFGPGAKIASGARIRSFSHIEGATIATGAEVGPYARLRPGADLGEGAKVGNFVEVKNVRMGKGAKANHLAYLGDGEVGAKANIGAGVIFCNYDGFFKHRTTVGEGAFVGSNSSLVAPVTIGAGAMVGSGSVITRDVAPGDLALARGEQSAKTGWAARFMEKMRAKKVLKSK
ncbi:MULTISPECIES: bifunctional UDP-N-acetylglucosamine diphosphorylase/glucosamine-1-phosphate N-acetyltransferase GlmU [unclassified Brevundimonas]|uniref:bifunctional UDP-N-acetylglucosamine diphosphorylase/glucosamine-1-phosphate N-acetyltransferase GlmU n=1 Tax=unclassified Brevundimonas TaxID=2622653 RepID=UPI0006F9EF4B|nr:MULTISPECIES: bifunctional UDP-N-acetylglucosamine diphosphorylase/glucosamine-1-phosphate N-acetyltransferase GlmU [unclassified Brevundimonas]KQY73548.1 bifunctional N-acetylglucosamine-1-phosphate uridyltransferase/glucosamine-1-phosphate acetyltransferase [Brevundimonas sp. Root1423]KRA29148.1 bifunctional N-acetylglucosamine-1-phosphate uridyltransferase/glucosamine-1-phosphate acetyltransferase [Brevundimonas sp. Root608]